MDTDERRFKEPPRPNADLRETGIRLIGQIDGSARFVGKGAAGISGLGPLAAAIAAHEFHRINFTPAAHAGCIKMHYDGVGLDVIRNGHNKITRRVPLPGEEQGD